MLDAIHREQKLKICSLLGPKHAVVIKGRDPSPRPNKIREPSLVTRSTNATVVSFGAVSFHDASGSAPRAKRVVRAAASPAALTIKIFDLVFVLVRFG